MAATGFGTIRSALRLGYSPTLWYGGGHNIRCYSVFPPSYKEPIVDKEMLKKFVSETPEKELLAMKFKPATNSQTCSIFYHPDLEKFINCSMSKGNKHIAKELIRSALTRIKHVQLRKYNSETDEEKKESIIINPLEIFLLAVKNVTPLLWYMKIKKSGTWYKVPVGISPEKARRKSIKWLIEATNEKNVKVPFDVQLAIELVDAAHYTGKAVKKKIELHKACEANRGYIHYWWT